MSGFDRTVAYCRGAYGREVSLSDYQAGKDFRLCYGPYFSIRDENQMRTSKIETLVFLNMRGFVEFVINL